MTGAEVGKKILLPGESFTIKLTYGRIFIGTNSLGTSEQYIKDGKTLFTTVKKFENPVYKIEATATDGMFTFQNNNTHKIEIRYRVDRVWG